MIAMIIPIISPCVVDYPLVNIQKIWKSWKITMLSYVNNDS